MARRWKMAALTMAWLGGALPLQAQTPPPPVPIGPSGMGGPVAYLPVSQPMQPGGPMAPWNSPVPGAGPRVPPGGPGGAPMPGNGAAPGSPDCDTGSLDLDAKAIRHNAFNGDEGGNYHPIAHQMNLEYLILWFKGHHHQPLVTTGDPNDPEGGLIGGNTTRILHGYRDGPGASNAFRFTYTYWLVDPECVCIDTSFFIMEQRSLVFEAASNSNGEPLLARPFFNVSFNTEDADIRANPFEKSGSVRDVFLTRLMGAEANIKWNVTGAPCSSGPTLTLLAGPRWIRLDEKYFSNDVSQDIITAGETRVFSDNITCYNEFIGGQVGGTIRARWDRLTLDWTTKIAVGQNFHQVRLSGQTAIRDDVTGEVTTTKEGLYVQTTNSGTFRPEHISIVPETNLNLGIYLTENIKFSVGYGVFNMNNVIRPGNVIDRRVEVQAPGIPTSAPSTNFPTTDFWAQWVNFGLEFSF